MKKLTKLIEWLQWIKEFTKLLKVFLKEPASFEVHLKDKVTPWMQKLLRMAYDTLKWYLLQQEISWKLDILRAEIQRKLNKEMDAKGEVYYYWDFIERNLQGGNGNEQLIAELESMIIAKLMREIKKEE